MKKTARKTPTPKKQPPTIGGVLTTNEYSALTKQQVISELTKSPHGNLGELATIGLVAAKEDQDFFAHLIAWNHVKGQVRDSKTALPVIALTGTQVPEFVDNALAHIADLRPREFDAALRFGRLVKAPSNVLRRLAERYLRDLEANYGDWERTVVLHAKTLKGLYGRYHIKPGRSYDSILFKGEATSPRLTVLKGLKSMSPEEIAGAISGFKLPFLKVRGILGPKMKDPDVLCAIIGRMSPTELVTNMKALERLGVKDHPATRGALDKAMQVAASSKKATLKTSKAADVIEDEALSAKLRTLQEKQLDAIKGVEGDWLVLGDRSGSMHSAILAANEVAGTLARLVRGKVHLVFFNDMPQYFDVTGKTLEEIKTLTRNVTAGGNTNIGCGLGLLIERGLTVDGIAVVTDGGENQSPVFALVYEQYVKRHGNEPTVYMYAVGNVSFIFEHNCSVRNIKVEKFDVRGSDYYSIPNLAQTMRVGRYSLYDEIMQTNLVTLDQVLDRTKGQAIVARTLQAV